jgi:hypothetical protein
MAVAWLLQDGPGVRWSGRLETARMFERDASAAQLAREPRYGPRPIRTGPRAMDARMVAGSPGGIHD